MEDFPSDQTSTSSLESKRKKTHSGGDQIGTSPPRRKKKDTKESLSVSTLPTASEDKAYAQIAGVYDEEDARTLQVPLADVLWYLKLVRGCNRTDAKTKQLFPNTAPLIETLTHIADHPRVTNRAMQARLTRLLAALS
jgi:hypothetical protein